MRHRNLRSNSLKRFFSASFGRRSSNDEIAKENELSELPASEKMESLPVAEPSWKPNWKCFSYEEIFEATNGFHAENLVGRGGYAEVYKGVKEDGHVIAVKKLIRTSNEKKEKEFLTELGTIGHVHHPNVSSFLGCCVDNGLYLIFEFTLCGSVASLLHDEKLPPLAWKIRYKIAIGTAHGLHYLHKGCQRRIIHRDIKTSNVPLTADFEPQILQAIKR